MKPTIEHFCNVLARSRLLGADEIRALRQRWMQTGGSQDLEKFQAWLPSTGALTEHQVGVLARGHAEQLFLGPYTIRERVGKGRMAGVYKAVHSLGQTVAIKVLPPSKAKDPRILARFQREAFLALKLKHPNIVRTFQTGRANSLHFLVMEYLEGEPLDKVLQRRGPLQPGEAARLVHQILLGLQHLHEQGLIHRDIKPANLMLIGGRPESTLEATLKILDIGTGRALFDDATLGGDLTNDSDLLGTPEYMAPEQIRNPHGADIRADIYSAGCVLYHALAGRPPFQNANRYRLLISQATEEPRPVRDFNRTVPDGLEQVLNWMLAKDPGKRYPNPGRAAGALQTFLAAGAEVVPIEKDPGMSVYLDWLAVVPDSEAAGAISVEAQFIPPAAPGVVEVEAVLEEEWPATAAAQPMRGVVEVEAEIEVEAEFVDEPPRRRPPQPPRPPRKPERR